MQQTGDQNPNAGLPALCPFTGARVLPHLTENEKMQFLQLSGTKEVVANADVTNHLAFPHSGHS